MSVNKGAVPYHNPSCNNTSVNIKATAGKVTGILVCNMAVGARFLKLYDLATAPVVGTTVPVVTVPLPANMPSPTFINFAPADANIEEEAGILFYNGIGIAATNAAADTDVANPATGDVVVNIFYH